MNEPPSPTDLAIQDRLVALQTGVRELLDSVRAERGAGRKARERQGEDVAQEVEVSAAHVLQEQGLMRRQLDHVSDDLGRLSRELSYLREDLTSIRRTLSSVVEQQAAMKRLLMER